MGQLIGSKLTVWATWLMIGLSAYMGLGPDDIIVVDLQNANWTKFITLLSRIGLAGFSITTAWMQYEKILLKRAERKKIELENKLKEYNDEFTKD